MPEMNLSTSNSKSSAVNKGDIKEFEKQHSEETVLQKTHENTSQFKKFMLRLFLPLMFILTVFLFLFTYFFEQTVILGSEICGAYKINRNISQTNPAEVPMLGSSRAQGSFLPDSLGNNYFNYGMDGVGYNVVLMMLEEECKKQKTEPMIVINFDMEGLRSMTGDIDNYLYNAGYPPVKQLLGEDYKPYYSIPVIKYYSHFEMYTKYYLNDKMKLTKYTNKGASIEKNVLPEQKFYELVRQRESYVTTFENEPILEKRLFNLIQNNPSRQFVFVVSPYHQSYFNKYKNLPEAKRFLARLNAIENVKVFDFSHDVYADNLFMNTTHINYDGALVFNKILKDSLATIRDNRRISNTLRKSF
jgi:hypothetical protein